MPKLGEVNIVPKVTITCSLSIASVTIPESLLTANYVFLFSFLILSLNLFSLIFCQLPLLYMDKISSVEHSLKNL